MSDAEAELEVAATLGQSLLQHNDVLRARHDSLAARLSTPGSPALPPSMTLSPSLASFVGISASSPRPGSSGGTMQRTVSSPPLGVDENEPPVRTMAFDSFTVPSPRKRRSRQRQSTVSTSHSIASSLDLGRPTAPVGRTAESAALEQLEARNLELAMQLEELQAETARADRHGKQRLRKLDREIVNLRDELAQAGQSQVELERKLALRPSEPSPPLSGRTRQTSGGSVFVDPDGRDYEWPPKPPAMSRAPLASPVLPPASDPDNGEPSQSFPPTTPTRSSSLGELDPCTPTTSSAARGESAVVAELVAKIAELESANLTISAEREDMDERLARAQMEMDSMRRSYELLEDELIRSERDKLDYPDRRSIAWSEVRSHCLRLV